MARLEADRRLGILGGTFDPVHCGHLKLAESARTALGLEKVFFVPAYTPPHKRKHQVSEAALRLKMLELATAGIEYISVSTFEIEKQGISYTIETLRELKRQFPAAELYFITGSDAVPELKTWKDIERIFELCRFIIAERPDFPVQTLPENAVLIKGDFLDVSSSRIRQMVRSGMSVKEFLPEKVHRFITENKIYA